ncbi:MAG: lysophospholipid transporter LplT [Gammaproteobacteria bacterium]
MNRNIAILLGAQFITAFADNSLLFTAIAIIMQSDNHAAWYVPVIQAAFLVAFVVLAPWIGPYADSRPKARVLTIANLIKVVGAGLMLAQINIIFAYAIVGIGAAMYSPAKYGILPELASHQTLVRVNGWMEGSTILAILLGSLIGAKIAEASITSALITIIVLYIISAIAAIFIARIPPREIENKPALPNFICMTKRLLATSRARFATLGVSLFWGAAAVMRVILVAWAPTVLMISEVDKIAELTLYIAIGLVVGSLIVPKFIPLEHLRRARIAAFVMGLLVVIFSFVGDVWTARAVLLLIGIAGGMFVVPVNAALQEIGHQTIGSGGAVAVQHFFENLAMIATTGIYALAAGYGATPVASIFFVGIFVLLGAYFVSRRLPPEDAVEENAG